MDMFEDLVEDKNHIDLYDIYVYNDEFDNLIIDYMAKNNQNMKTFRKKNGSYLLDHIENLVHYNFLSLLFFHIDMFEDLFFDMVNNLQHDKPNRKQKNRI